MADDLDISLIGRDKGFTRLLRDGVMWLKKLQTQTKATGAASKSTFSEIGSAAHKGFSTLYSGVTRAFRALTSLQSLLIGGGLVVGFKKMIGLAVDFQSGLAEISTLLDGDVSRAMERYKGKLEDLVTTSSRSLGDLTNALYQTISAGVTDEAQAFQVLDLAQKSAVAGLTDTAVAVDAITTEVNAFGLSMEDTAKASDLLFTTVRRGKTRFEPLAHNIGKVATLASQAGVTLEEMHAAVATLTKAGLDTEMATTALRQFFANLLQPSEQAKVALKALGLQWGEGALAGGKFTETLHKMNEVSGGSAEVLADLVPNIRGLMGALVLAGEQVEVFDADLLEMKNSAGATEEAFGKMAKTAKEQMAVQWQRISLVFQRLGEKLLPTVLDWLERFANWAEGNGRKIIDVFLSIGEAIKELGEFIFQLPALAQYMLQVDDASRRVSALKHEARGMQVSGGAVTALRQNQQLRDFTDTVGHGGPLQGGDVSKVIGQFGVDAGSEMVFEQVGAMRRQAYIMAEVNDDLTRAQADFLVTMASQLESALDQELKTIADKEQKHYLESEARARKSAAVAAAARKKAASEASKEQRDEIGAITKQLDQQLLKQGDAFEQLDAWYQSLFEKVKGNKEALAKLDEVYFLKLAQLDEKRAKSAERTAKRAETAWKRFHREEQSRTERLVKERFPVQGDGRAPVGQQFQGAVQQGGGQVGGMVSNIAQGAQSGGPYGAIAAAIISLGFSGAMDPAEYKRKASTLKVERDEKLSTAGDDQEKIDEIKQWYSQEMKALQDARKGELLQDWEKKVRFIGTFAENVLRNLGGIIESLLGTLPENIARATWTSFDLEVLVSAIARGIYKFIINFGSTVKDLFTGEGKNSLRSIASLGLSKQNKTAGRAVGGILTVGISEVAELFHDGGLINGPGGGNMTVLGAAARSIRSAHSGTVVDTRGLRSDEVPIVAQAGERVLSRQQNAEYEAGLAGATINHNYNVNLDGVLTTEDTKRWLDRIGADVTRSGGRMTTSVKRAAAGRAVGRKARVG